MAERQNSHQFSLKYLLEKLSVQSKSFLKFTETFYPPQNSTVGERICDVPNFTVSRILSICTHCISSVRTVWNRKQGASREPKKPFLCRCFRWKSHLLWCLHSALLSLPDACTQQQTGPEVVVILKDHQIEGEVKRWLRQTKTKP